MSPRLAKTDYPACSNCVTPLDKFETSKFVWTSHFVLRVPDKNGVPQDYQLCPPCHKLYQAGRVDLMWAMPIKYIGGQTMIVP